MTIRLLGIVVVAKLTIIEDSHENLAINPGLILVQIFVQDVTITTLLRTIPDIMIVIDLDMINLTKTPPHAHIIILALILIQPPLVTDINLTFVPMNALLAIRTLLLDAINHHTALLLNHALIATEAAFTLTRGIIQIPTQYKPTINLTQQPVPNIQHSSSTEPKFELNMYYPNTSSCSQSSNNQANAITPSTWFVNLYIFKPPEDTSAPSKLELLFPLDSSASICVLNLSTFTILHVKTLTQKLIKLRSLFFSM